MRKIYLLLSFLFFTILFYYAESTQHDSNISLIRKSDKITEDVNFTNVKRSFYNISAKIYPNDKKLWVDQSITFFNTTDTALNEIYLINYPLLEYALEENKKIDFEAIILDGSTINFEQNIDKSSIPGESLLKLVLEKQLLPNDSLIIDISYQLSIPQNSERLGYAKGRNFFMITNWYPQLAVYQSGKWATEGINSFTNKFSEFADYVVEIELPEGYTLISNLYKDLQNEGGIQKFYFKEKNINDFSFAFSDNIILKERTIISGDKNVFVKLAVQPEHEKYFERYFTAVDKSIKFMSRVIGPLPYSSMHLVDLPKSCELNEFSYPGLFTIRTDLFTANNDYSLEYRIAQKVAKQYFLNTLAPNGFKEDWIGRGIPSYFASKIVEESFGKKQLTFHFVKYLPIYGMELMAYNEIPIIYTLADIEAPPGTNSLFKYYRNKNRGSISEPSYSYPTTEAYQMITENKTELMFLCLENIIGEGLLFSILKKFYNQYKYQHPGGSDLWELISINADNDVRWFNDNFYKGTVNWDYKISGISKLAENKYEVFAERLGDGIFKNDVVLITKEDTIWQYWGTNERWKKFEFITNNEVIAAEIDPLRKNLLDLNFSNNSFTVDQKIWGSLSITIRWFFWVQNALMILGSVG